MFDKGFSSSLVFVAFSVFWVLLSFAGFFSSFLVWFLFFYLLFFAVVLLGFKLDVAFVVGFDVLV
jgi:hypothetical protein